MSETARARAVRWLLLGLAVATTVYGALVFFDLLAAHGEVVLVAPLMALFVALFFWISVSFWTATLGALRVLLRSSGVAPGAPTSAPRPDRPLPRTAILMPVYNEAPLRPFASIRAMYESLDRRPEGERFDFFVLSDTTEPDVWLEEERAWAAVRSAARGRPGLYYRRRARNVARKSGNIADFCEQWGSDYEYMVVLDADSLMSADALVEMVRRMEAEPRVGILQAPPVPTNRGSLFARAQQFAAGVYGVPYTSGYSLWAQTDANYWGHNAIIRVQPFIECCGLPRLSGDGPLGGDILSHDFVEAALMRRAGWEVRLAGDLAGSYEECPTTLTDFALRDRRWAQGNLQHLRLVLLHGFHPISRVHLGSGAMAYLSSPLWLAFLVLGVLGGVWRHTVGHPTSTAGALTAHPGLVVFLVTLAMLLLPKLWGYLLLLLRSRDELARYGGAGGAGLSVLTETLMSALIAPIMTAFHSTFVVSILTGHKVGWAPQRRGARGVSTGEAMQVHAVHTIAGLGALLAVKWLAPSIFWWIVPVLVGLVFSVPLAMALGSMKLGRAAREAGLFRVPEESAPPSILRRQRRLIARTHRARARRPDLDPFGRAMLSPVQCAVHLAILEAGAAAQPSTEDVDRLERTALYAGTERLTRREKLSLLADAEAFRRLHRAAWRTWPLETLEKARPAQPEEA